MRKWRATMAIGPSPRLGDEGEPRDVSLAALEVRVKQVDDDSQAGGHRVAYDIPLGIGPVRITPCQKPNSLAGM
jgi:hypothetical protein